MVVATELEQARRCAEWRQWREAFTRFTAVDRECSLEPADLSSLALVAYFLGRDAESVQTSERAFQAHLERGDPASAAQCAFWLGLRLLLRGEEAHGGGWLGRAQRLIDDGELDCVAQGYLLASTGVRIAHSGEFRKAYELFTEALEVGRRFGEPDLLALARHGRGRAQIGLGDVAAGLGVLDEVMASVTAGELSPVPTGMIYCSVIEACHDVADLRRAHEWTAALAAWCATQPDSVPFRGQCLVHRSEVLRLRGSWADAGTEIEQACRMLTDPAGQAALGAARYQQAELLRLRGDFGGAEQCYRDASEHGCSPQPGLALLRLAQGKIEAATAAIRHAAGQPRTPRARAGGLAAQTEILLAAGDTEGARVAADELCGLATALGAPLLRALAAHAEGAVLLAEGELPAAVDAARDACCLWAAIEVPYEAARSHVLLGRACQRLGDDDTACLELEIARRMLSRLGAEADLAALDGRAAPAGPLTGREVEVLALVAAGRSNRQIAAELVISEHTVRRHLQNAFAKIGVSSRAAATTYAHRHHLV